eukprot:gene15653-biopygen23209
MSSLRTYVGGGRDGPCFVPPPPGARAWPGTPKIEFLSDPASKFRDVGSAIPERNTLPRTSGNARWNHLSSNVTELFELFDVDTGQAPSRQNERR